MKKEKRQEVQPYPQQSIDLMFWQYAQGAKDALCLNTETGHGTKIYWLTAIIADKLKHIQTMHHGRRPAFDLKAEWVNDKIEIKKIMLP